MAVKKVSKLNLVKTGKELKSLSFRLPIPLMWIENMGITESDRDVELSFDGTEIRVRKSVKK